MLAAGVESGCLLQGPSMLAFKAKFMEGSIFNPAGPSMSAIEAKIYVVVYNQSSSITFDETSSIGQRQKAPNLSAFHWSPHGSLVSIG